MKALQALTDLFKAHVTDSAKFDAWAEDGALFSAPSFRTTGFELEYTAIIFLQNVKVKPEVLMMHLVNWINKHDPERQEKGLAQPTFATEILDNGRCDIKIKIDLQETYELEEDANGNWQQDGIRYSSRSQFETTVDIDDLETLEYVGGHEDDLP